MDRFKTSLTVHTVCSQIQTQKIEKKHIQNQKDEVSQKLPNVLKGWIPVKYLYRKKYVFL